jgi:hypothetical protein
MPAFSFFAFSLSPTFFLVTKKSLDEFLGKYDERKLCLDRLLEVLCHAVCYDCYIPPRWEMGERWWPKASKWLMKHWNSKGSFDLPNYPAVDFCHLWTAFVALTLAIPYRLLPLFQE